MDTDKLQQALAGRVDGEVRFDAGSRAAYAHDGSNYRQPPLGVVLPRSPDAAQAAVQVCAEFGAPVLSRGGGTSLAGQCCNTAVVIDWTKYCHRVISVDPGGRTAMVEPGIALDKLNDAVRKYGLMVGPKPSTHVSCTIGGRIGNNSCGSTASHRPLACEGLDDVLISLEREEHLAADALDKLPEGSGWLMVQFGGDTEKEANEKAQALIDAVQADGDHPRPHVAYTEDPAVEDNLDQVRELGLGATAYPPGKHETHEGWEDAAVPPERLGDYLRDFRALLARHGYHGASLYGHFGHGCVHTRIPFELRTAEGIASYRSFTEDAADLVVSYGGSLSGEHGDGQSRGELLPKMFGSDLVRAFGELKDVFDPDNRMNPGKVVQPYRLDENLTRRGWFPREPRTFFRYAQDGGKFSAAASRCVGIGKCRGDEGGVMCPSYRVTREEEHSTRGRARLLMEMVRGEVITHGWHSTEVLGALDLCLACKGCRKECPVGVDMATYKAEFLAHHYAGRVRPAAHYSMGWLPLIAALVAAVPGLPGMVNLAGRTPGISGMTKRAGGIDSRRDLPRFARQRFTTWYVRRQARRASSGPSASSGPGVSQPQRQRRVILWPDTFTNNFHPEVAKAAVTVLERAGFRVDVPTRPMCCGLTWISTGQLGMARRMLRRTIKALLPDLRVGVRVVVLEPSCAAVFRADAAELLGSDDARLLAARTRTLAELLVEAGWQPGGLPEDLSTAAGREGEPARGERGRRAIAQVHCHQHAIMGFDPDTEILRRCGVDVDVLDTGCCGLAGNFGFERGHYEVSAACAERGLWPAARAAGPQTAILADGFSCRTQLAAGHTGREGLHLAQLLERRSSSGVRFRRVTS